jgi:hypothetical protein
MDALTLSRKVADIDGWSGVDTVTNVGALSAVVDGKGGVMGKALLLDLIFKYKVELTHWDNNDGCVFIGNDVYNKTYEFSSHESLPRAILECIIQANDLR